MTPDQALFSISLCCVDALTYCLSLICLSPTQHRRVSMYLLSWHFTNDWDRQFNIWQILFFLSLARFLFTSAISTNQGEKDLFSSKLILLKRRTTWPSSADIPWLTFTNENACACLNWVLSSVRVRNFESTRQWSFVLWQTASRWLKGERREGEKNSNPFVIRRSIARSSSSIFLLRVLLTDTQAQHAAFHYCITLQVSNILITIVAHCRYRLCRVASRFTCTRHMFLILMQIESMRYLPIRLITFDWSSDEKKKTFVEGHWRLLRYLSHKINEQGFDSRRNEGSSTRSMEEFPR